MTERDASENLKGSERTLRSMQSRSGQAESYLEQAVESLRSAGDPLVLWEPASAMYVGSPLEDASRVNVAGNRRVRLLRGAVIFAAIAVEAYANGFLHEHLTPADVDALDKLSAIDKLLLGPRLAGLTAPLERGSEPLQTLTELFRARNRLVHPRSRAFGAYLQYLDESDEKVFGPAAAARFIGAVAQAIRAMEATCPGRTTMAGNAALLSAEPGVLDDLLTQVGRTLNDLVSEDSPRPLDPVAEAQRRRMIRAQRERTDKQPE